MPYAPIETQNKTPIQEAITILENHMDEYGIHTVYEGENLINGQKHGKAVVCVVEQKGKLKAQTQEIPRYITTSTGNRIPTDVVANPQPKDQRLWLDDATFRSFAQNGHQECFDCPIPGGAQIAPQNARWVGTLSCVVKFKGKDEYGFLTNEHVTGLNAIGVKMCQPHGQAGWFGQCTQTGQIDFSVTNYIDAACGTIRRNDGIFGKNGYTDTIGPEIFGLGTPKKTIKSPQVGMIVKKSGRTTGITTGRIVGINATSRVGYGDNQVATFRRQLVIEASSGLFSNSGDSGSHILSDDMQHVGLLFAGGGGQTIANDISLVCDGLGVEFF